MHTETITLWGVIWYFANFCVFIYLFITEIIVDIFILLLGSLYILYGGYYHYFNFLSR
jgi:hypothetical protein